MNGYYLKDSEGDGLRCNTIKEDGTGDNFPKP